MVNPKNKGRWYVGIAVATIIISIILYVYLAAVNPEFPVKDYLYSLVVLVMIMTGAGFVLYFIGSKTPAFKESELEKIKDPIHLMLFWSLVLRHSFFLVFLLVPFNSLPYVCLFFLFPRLPYLHSKAFFSP